MTPPIFVTCSSFLIPTYSENLIYLALTVLKFKKLADQLRGIPQPGKLSFSRTLVFPDVFNRSNFEYSAFSGLKEDSWKRKRKKKKNSI